MMKTEQQASYQPRKKMNSELPYLQLAFLSLLVYNAPTSHKKQVIKNSKKKKNVVNSSCPVSNKMRRFTQKLIVSKVCLQSGKEIGV